MRGLSLLLGGCGAVAAVLGWQALVPFFPPDPAGASMAVRLGQGCAALLPGAAVLALMVLAQMALRFATGAVDPLAGHDARLLRVNQRAISNTVEQFLVFAPAVLTLSAGVPGQRMGQVTALGAVFALARLVFWLGYLAAPLGRAFGMAATLTATLAALAAAAWFWVH
ncbi:MAG: MAPEG family protein [Acetobacteraceae bacterium]|nr:MAPEG family protein [Acetobacteraceae bacterium]